MIATSPVSCKLPLAKSIVASTCSPSVPRIASNDDDVFVPQPATLLGIQCLVPQHQEPLVIPTNLFSRIHDDFSVTFDAPPSGSVIVNIMVTLNMTNSDVGSQQIYQALTEHDGAVVPHSIQHVASGWWDHKLTTQYRATINHLMPGLTYTWYAACGSTGHAAAYVISDGAGHENFPTIEVWG